MITRLENTSLPTFQICKTKDQYILEFPKRNVRFPITCEQLHLLKVMLSQKDLLPLASLISSLSVEHQELIQKHLEVVND